jgi:hypothetical protein
MINYTKKELKLTPRLQKKLKELNIISVNINEDINVYIAKLFTSDIFLQSVFGKKFEKYDWERLYYSLKQLLRSGAFINNGILMEKMSSFIISSIEDIYQIMETNDLEFEDPDKGTDLLFIDSDYILRLFEVKSIIPDNGRNYITNSFVVNRIREALSSLFCKNLKNVNKLCFVRENFHDIKKAQKAHEIAREILISGGNSLIEYTSRDTINFNICIIGKEFKIVETTFKVELEKLFYSTYKCKSDCIYLRGGSCDKSIIQRLKIFNLYEIEFIGNLSINEIYREIIKIIKGIEGAMDE